MFHNDLLSTIIEPSEPVTIRSASLDAPGSLALTSHSAYVITFPDESTFGSF